MNIRNIYICFVIGTEGMNILNNAIAINISLPNILRRILQNIKNKSK
ncbi:phage holin family protein [Megamonas funiformis]